jgi:hypothetical protein
MVPIWSLDDSSILHPPAPELNPPLYIIPGWEVARALTFFIEQSAAK